MDVINIVDGKKTGKSKNSKENNKNSAFSKIELCKKIPDIMQQNATCVETHREGWKFQSKFICAEAGNSGAHIVLEVLQNDVVREVDMDYVANQISIWAKKVIASPDGDKYSLLSDYANCLSVAKSWRAIQKPEAEMPVALRFKSDPGYCFSRLAFDLASGTTPEQFPSWNKILNRITTNSEQFAMRVAAMFDKNANRKQAIWLWGPGDTGKSLIFNAIGSFFKATYQPMHSSMTNGNFWLHAILNKRVVYIYECTGDFITAKDSLFKGITGESLHLVNRKGTKHIPARLDCLLVMSSNDPLKLPPDDALYNRIIECHIDELSAEDKHTPEDVIKARLVQEFPAFLSWAWEMYQAKKAPNGTIIVDRQSMIDGTQDLYQEECDLFDRYFDKVPGHQILRLEVGVFLRSLGHCRSDQSLGRVYKAWAACRGVKLGKLPGNRRDVLNGLKIKDSYRQYGRTVGHGGRDSLLGCE